MNISKFTVIWHHSRILYLLLEVFLERLDLLQQFTSVELFRGLLFSETVKFRLQLIPALVSSTGLRREVNLVPDCALVKGTRVSMMNGLYSESRHTSLT